jgi:hypothetical protein
LATKTIADAIAKDGPTRRMLYRQDLLNLISKEPELEFTEDEQRLVEIEKNYGELLRKWAETPEKVREAMTNLMREQLQEITNENLRKGN